MINGERGPQGAMGEPGLNKTKMVQIVVMFVADTDEEALAVKMAIAVACNPWSKIVTNFTLTERPVTRSGA